MRSVTCTQRKLLLMICIFCFLVFALLNHKWILSFNDTILNFHNKAKRHPIILLYTSWNVEQYWSNLYPEKLQSHLTDVKCPIKDCKISYDKDILPEASAVLFHGQDLGSVEMYSPESLAELKRPANQVWIWVNQESPSNLQNARAYNGLFNWTATYHRRSDIFLPYGHYAARKSIRNYAFHNKIRKIIRSKKGLVAWAVSDCNGVREKYVLKLQEYVNVTVFGKCKTKFKNQDTCFSGTQECAKKLSEFKFYLAFENSFCEDYVTEKYWNNALEHDSVPIVFGKNYDAKVAIPGSYINVNMFKTVREMAQFIKFLDKNDQQYAKYFTWRRKFKILPVTDLVCSVCQKLHRQPIQRKIYENLGGFWNKNEHCIEREDILEYGVKTNR